MKTKTKTKITTKITTTTTTMRDITMKTTIMKKITLSILALVLPTLVNADIQHYFAVPEGTDVAGFISSSTNPTLDNSDRLVSEDSTGTPLIPYPLSGEENQSRNDAGNLLYYTTTNNAATIIQNLLDANPFYANDEGEISIDFYQFIENTEPNAGDNVFNASGSFVYYRSSEIEENPSDSSDKFTAIRNLMPQYGASEIGQTHEISDIIGSGSENKDNDLTTDLQFAAVWGFTGGEWGGLNTSLVGANFGTYVGACGDVAGVDGRVQTIECIGGSIFAPDSPQRLFTADLKLKTGIDAATLNIIGKHSTLSAPRNYSFVVSEALTAPDLADETTTEPYLRGDDVTLTFTNSGGGALDSCTSSPTLPAGLSVAPSADISTCEITGNPTTITADTTYTITASNSAGDSAATVNIETASAPDLADLEKQYAINSDIDTSLVNNGGTGITECTVAPALPTGLTLSVSDDANASTCEITGATSGATQAATVYTVTATNGQGVGTSTVNITISSIVEAPSLANASAVSFFVGVEIDPIVFVNGNGALGRATECSGSNLPDGLTVAVSGDSCTITGVPTGDSAAKDYTVTAGNAIGDNTAKVNITVVALAVARTDNNGEIVNAGDAITFGTNAGDDANVYVSQPDGSSSNLLVLTDIGYTFTPPTTGNFAGEYTINVRGVNVSTFTVPVIVRLARSGLFEGGSGAYATTTVTVLGMSDSGTASLTVDNALVNDSADTAVITVVSDNQATANVSTTADDVSAIAEFSITATYLGTTATVVGNVIPTTAYTGNIVDDSANANAISGATIMHTNASGDEFETTSDANGGFTLTLTTGAELVIAASTYATKVVDSADAGADGSFGNITLSTVGISVAGSVTPTAAAAAYKVFAVSASDNTVFGPFAQTASTYSIDLATGIYTIYVEADGYLRQVKHNIGADNATAVDFTLEEKHAVTYSVVRDGNTLTFSGGSQSLEGYTVVAATAKDDVLATGDSNGLVVEITDTANLILRDADGDAVFAYEFIVSNTDADNRLGGSQVADSSGFSTEFSNSSRAGLGVNSSVQTFAVDSSNAVITHGADTGSIARILVTLTPVNLNDSTDSKAIASDGVFYRLDVTAILADGSIVDIDETDGAITGELIITMSYDTSQVTVQEWTSRNYGVYHAETLSDLESGNHTVVSVDNIDILNSKIVFRVSGLSGFSLGTASPTSTSSGGGGCALASNSTGLDLTFYLLMIAAVLGLLRRRQKTVTA